MAKPNVVQNGGAVAEEGFPAMNDSVSDDDEFMDAREEVTEHVTDSEEDDHDDEEESNTMDSINQRLMAAIGRMEDENQIAFKVSLFTSRDCETKETLDIIGKISHGTHQCRRVHRIGVHFDGESGIFENST